MKNNSEALISVIIPAYNSSQYIKDAIDSVLGQTHKNFEIIVVDDGSTDDTKKVLSPFMKIIKYMYKENSGPASARNLGIKQSAGEFIAFLDSDDIWLDSKLEYQLKAISESNLIGLVTCSAYITDESGKIQKELTCKDYINKKKLLNDFLVRNIVTSSSSVLIRKEYFNRVGLFDETLAVAEDWDMWLRICKNYEFRRVNRPLVKIRTRIGSQSGGAEKNLENELKFISKTFSEDCFKGERYLKRDALKRCYFRAAIAHKEEGNIGKARKAFLKSFKMLKLFDKKYFLLFVQLFLGEKIFNLAKKGTCCG